MQSYIVKYIGLGLLLLSTLVGCKKEKGLGEMQIAAVQSLLLPANNAHVVIEPKQGTIDFTWTASATSDNRVILYEVVFDKTDGDFSKPLFTYPSESNGLNPRLTLSHAELNKIASTAGIASLTTGKIKWTVRASKGVNMLQSPVINILEVDRPAGFSETPAALYLTGTATENGTDMTKALKFTRSADGIFEIYTRLGTGTYHFSTDKTSTGKAFSANGNGLVADGETTVASGTVVYRIRVNFSSATVDYTEITAVGLFLSGDNKVIFTLPYTGNGTFTAQNAPVSFKQESWGRDERYKLRMEVKKNTAAVEWLGSINRDNQAPVSTTAASYFYVYSVDNSQYDYSFKFIKDADNKNVDVTLKMNAESVYTHTVTVK